MHAVYKYETLCKDRCPKATSTPISFRDKIARCSVWKALWKIVEGIFITLFSTWTWNLASFSFTSASIPGATFCAVLQRLRWCCVKCVIHHERDVREEQHHRYTWREHAIIEWSWYVNSIVASCHSAKLCALAARDIRSQRQKWVLECHLSFWAWGLIADFFSLMIITEGIIYKEKQYLICTKRLQQGLSIWET